ncbi:hypothetical protein ACFQY5_30475 [Paeniroseomonas aquatica]|uniref:hypothetical protein n=1 Tax=Paeniroseomonas aquatica TaxID=373043 RepID=UPI003609F178
MEQPVGQGIEPQVRHAVGGVAGAGQHVVPLQDLVQHDAVEEAAEAEAEEDAGGGGEGLGYAGGWGHAAGLLWRRASP